MITGNLIMYILCIGPPMMRRSKLKDENNRKPSRMPKPPGTYRYIVEWRENEVWKGKGCMSLQLYYWTLCFSVKLNFADSGYYGERESRDSQGLDERLSNVRESIDGLNKVKDDWF